MFNKILSAKKFNTNSTFNFLLNKSIIRDTNIFQKYLGYSSRNFFMYNKDIVSRENLNFNNNQLQLKNLMSNPIKKNFTIIDITNSNEEKGLFINRLERNKTIDLQINARNLSDNKGARKTRRRVGRGPGSSKGKTGGKGHMIYRVTYRHLIGGTTNHMRRLPKHGFRNKNVQDKFAYINIHKILYLIHKGRIDPTKPIGIKEIFYAGGVSKIEDGVKVLNRGSEHLKNFPALNLNVNSITEKALNAIKENGGSVTISHGTPLYNRYLLKPAKFNKDLNEPYPNFKKTRRMLRLRDKGAM
jgi:large subunit ribosomal protein L15